MAEGETVTFWDGKLMHAGRYPGGGEGVGTEVVFIYCKRDRRGTFVPQSNKTMQAIGNAVPTCFDCVIAAARRGG